MGCCCSRKTEKWSSPLLDLDDGYTLYRTEDILVQPPAPPNSPNDILIERTDTPYSSIGDDLVV